MSEKHKVWRLQRSRILTPEQQAMWRQDHRAEVKGKSQEERKSFKLKLEQELQAMSESERSSLRDRLQAKWNALPAEKKKKLEQKLSKRGGGKGGGGKGRVGAAKANGRASGRAAATNNCTTLSRSFGPLARSRALNLRAKWSGAGSAGRAWLTVAVASV